MPSEQDFIQRIQAHAADAARAIAGAEFWHAQWLAQAEREHKRRSGAQEAACQQAMVGARSDYETAAAALARDAAAAVQAAGWLAAAWDDPAWQRWTPVSRSESPLCVRIGQLSLADRWQRLTLPALHRRPQPAAQGRRRGQGTRRRRRPVLPAAPPGRHPACQAALHLR